MKKWAVLAAAALALAGCGGSDENGKASGPEPKTFTVSGTLTLTKPSGFVSTDENLCQGDGGYSDLRGGANVTVYDADGTKIGLSDLHTGQTDDTSCVFDFTITEVPVSKKDIYSIEVSHRGQQSFKRADAKDLSFTLG